MSRRSANHVILLTLLASATLGLSSNCIATAATLEQLSEARLIDESTEILRGTVIYCNQLYRQPVIWTVCEVAVTERFKGQQAAQVQVAIPGGTSSGFRQSFEGTPTLTRNTEYLFFLWQGKSGLKQIMGLSQGILNIAKDSNGNLIVSRAKADDNMVSPEGKPVSDTAISLRLSDLRSRISSRLLRGTRQ
jgi:hypothetical protein